MLEVTDAVLGGVGRRPRRHASGAAHGCHDMGDSDRLGTFTYVARELGKRKLGWIAAREAVMDENTKLVDSQGNPAFLAAQAQHRPAPEGSLWRPSRQ